MRLASDLYKKREEDLGEEVARQIERFAILSSIDSLWTDHLDAVENLREGIGLRGYGQKDPLVEYKNEAYTMFENLITAIDDEISHRIFRIQVAIPQMPEYKHVTEEPAGGDIGADEVSQKQQIGNSQQTTAVDSSQSAVSGKKKIGRNDPCWCGSGKKWKKCHYPQLPS